MRNYLELLKKIMEQGEDKEGRNGKTRGIFTEQLRFDLKESFPAVTTKKLYFDSVKAELLWFLAGSRSLLTLRRLTGKGTTIWDKNVDQWQSLNKHNSTDAGRIYGVQWRLWQKRDGDVIDQIGLLVEKLKNQPNDRRMVVTAWNPGELDQMCLPPCHMLFQCWLGKNGLKLHMVQRSCDMFLGVPFNIASYALLTHMLAQASGHAADELIVTLNDVHIYHEHFDAVEEQLKREPLAPPKLWLNPEVTDIDDFDMSDIRLDNYFSQAAIKAEML